MRFIYDSARPKQPSNVSPKLSVSSGLYHAFNMQEIDDNALEVQRPTPPMEIQRPTPPENSESLSLSGHSQMGDGDIMDISSDIIPSEDIDDLLSDTDVEEARSFAYSLGPGPSATVKVNAWQKTAKKRPASDEPQGLTPSEDLTSASILSKLQKITPKKTATLIDSSVNNNVNVGGGFVASQPKAVLCRLKQGRTPDGTFKKIPSEAADIETVLDELNRSYFAMIAGVKHEGSSRWKFRPLVTSHTGDKLRQEDFEHFLETARRIYRVVQQDFTPKIHV